MITLIPVHGIPLVHAGDDLASLLANALKSLPVGVELGDVLVVAQKIVSKAEGRVVRLGDVNPTPRARELAKQTQKDPHLVELILQESRSVVRAAPGVLIVEDRRGLVCANAGIDRSNVEQHSDGEEVLLLPEDPDASARQLHEQLGDRIEVEVPVVINDSHGRAWREGTVGVAIGIAGLPAVWDRRGDRDFTGYVLQHTTIGLADEIAAAASLVMGAAEEGVPAVLVKGIHLPQGSGTAKDMQRPAERDLFR